MNWRERFAVLIVRLRGRLPDTALSRNPLITGDMPASAKAAFLRDTQGMPAQVRERPPLAPRIMPAQASTVADRILSSGTVVPPHPGDMPRPQLPTQASHGRSPMFDFNEA